MSIAIQWGYYSTSNNDTEPLTQGFVYMDIVTAYAQTNSGKTSSHPISSGGKISDHFTKENKVISFSAIISGVDISTGLSGIVDENSNTPSNISLETVNAVSIKSSDKSLVDFLPDSIGQFFSPQKPVVTLQEASVHTYKGVKDLLESLFIDGNIQLVTLYEYEDNKLFNAPIQNLVLTNLTFKEDAESGDGLFIDFTLEQVTFVKTKKSAIPQDVKDKYKKQVALEQRITGGTTSVTKNTPSDLEKEQMDNVGEDQQDRKETADPENFIYDKRVK